MMRIQVVGVLFDLQPMGIYRIICRHAIGHDVRDYLLYVDRATAHAINRLLDERPFKCLRLMPNEAASLEYAGDMVPQPALSPYGARDRIPAVLYLELCHQRSRRKYRLEVEMRVLQQFRWLMNLTEHDGRHCRPLIEA